MAWGGVLGLETQAGADPFTTTSSSKAQSPHGPTGFQHSTANRGPNPHTHDPMGDSSYPNNHVNKNKQGVGGGNHSRSHPEAVCSLGEHFQVSSLVWRRGHRTCDSGKKIGKGAGASIMGHFDDPIHRGPGSEEQPLLLRQRRLETIQLGLDLRNQTQESVMCRFSRHFCFPQLA